MVEPMGEKLPSIFPSLRILEKDEQGANLGIHSYPRTASPTTCGKNRLSLSVALEIVE